jgi:hypothetical protein
MAQTQTGMERSLKVRITDNVTGEVKEFNGLNAFGVYGAINNSELAGMSKNSYDARLAAFKLYVESLLPGLNFAEQTAVPAYRQNKTACTIGLTVS